jgi:putative transposase
MALCLLQTPRDPGDPCSNQGRLNSGISKIEVSRICADLNSEVAAFRDRSLAGQSFPYVFLDATYCKARVSRRVISQAVWWPPGCAAMPPRGPRPRGGRLRGWRLLDRLPPLAQGQRPHRVQLVITDAHLGLRHAVQAVLAGAAMQRCRVQFLRNVLARVPKGSAETPPGSRQW